MSGVELQWEDLSIGRCFPPATGSAPLSLDTNAVAWPFRYLRLIAPGATGPVTVRISGTIPSA